MPERFWMHYCFRDDLEVQETSPGEGGPRFLVRDPATGEQFDFGDEEFFLCGCLNGRQDLSDIVSAFDRRFGFEPGEQHLVSFFDQLQALGLLRPCGEIRAPLPTSASPAAPPSSKSPENQKSYEEDDEDGKEGAPGRYTLFNPDRVFTLLARLFYPLRWTVWLLLPGVPLAALVLLFNQEQYGTHVDFLFKGGDFLQFLLFFLFTLLFVNLLSKLVQGIVALHFGADIGQFGIRLAFGVKPRFFINKKAIWRLHRQGRLWGFGSSLLTKLALFVIGILVWVWTFRTTPSLSLFALTAGHAGLATFFFTANPLWRADGYAWLVSYLELPRLRERSFHLLRLKLRGGDFPANLSARERYGLLAFAVATVSFLAYFLGMILIAVAIKLEQQLQGTGVVIFLLLLTLFLRWSLKTLKIKSERVKSAVANSIGQVFAPPFPMIEQGQMGAALPGSPGRQPTVFDAGSRFFARLRSIIVLAILVLVATLPYPYQAVGEALVKPAFSADARARFGGELVRALVKEGDWVEAGSLIAEIDGWEQRHAIRVMETDLAQKEAELALLRHGARAEEIAHARDQLKMAEVQAKHSRHLTEVLKPGIEEGAVTALQYAEAVKDAEVDLAAVAVARRNLELISSSALDVELDIKKAEIRGIEERLVQARSKLEGTRILAPISGTVATPDLNKKLGEFLQEGDLFASIEDSRTANVEIMIPETEIQDVMRGAAVELRVWSAPDRVLSGKVEQIAPRVEEAEDIPFLNVVRVTATILNADGLLKPKMTGYAKIDGGDKMVVVAFGRMLYRFFMIELWSWIP